MNHLGVAANPTSLVAGQSTTVTFTAYDQFNNPVTTYSDTVTLSDALSGGSFAGITFSNGVGAVAASLYKAGTDTVSVKDGTLTAGSAPITVTAASATHFTVSASPSSLTAGTSTTLNITALDAYGNKATGYGDGISFVGSSGGATVTGLTGSAGIYTATATLDASGSQTVTAYDSRIRPPTARRARRGGRSSSQSPGGERLADHAHGRRHRDRNGHG